MGHVINGVSQYLFSDKDLFQGRRVHETVILPVVIEVFRLAMVQVDVLNPLRGAEAVCDDVTHPHALELCLDQCRFIPRGQVLVIHHHIKLPIQLNHRTLLNVVSSYHTNTSLSAISYQLSAISYTNSTIT